MFVLLAAVLVLLPGTQTSAQLATEEVALDHQATDAASNHWWTVPDGDGALRKTPPVLEEVSLMADPVAMLVSVVGNLPNRRNCHQQDDSWNAADDIRLVDRGSTLRLSTSTIVRWAIVQRFVQNILTSGAIIFVIFIVIIVYPGTNSATTFRCIEIEVILLGTQWISHRRVIGTHFNFLPFGTRTTLLAKPPILFAIRAGTTDRCHSTPTSSTFVVTALFLLLCSA
uniref:Uncharacterized protein n=1 Tax=Anopheles culicifacies TaxID=139723 RepID=A0A182M4N7_9DIPT